MNAKYSLIALSICIGIVGGCHSKQTQAQNSDDKAFRGNKPPVLPSAGPTRVATPIDRALRTKALSELNKAFASSDPVLRANAIEGMQRSLGAVAGDRYKQALYDQSPLVRFAAAMAVGSAKVSEAKPVLHSLVEDPDASVQVGVRYALHQLGDHQFSHDLEVLAQNKDARVRGNVVTALGLLGEKSALKILSQMERDESGLVRLQVLEAEYRLGGSDAVEKLSAGCLSQYPDEKIICLLALGGRKDPTMIRFLEGQLVADWPEVSLAAARALGMVGADTGYGTAMNYVDSKEPRQRSMAALTFGDIGRADSQKYLSRLLNDSDPSVRLAAATAILQLKD